MHSPGYMLAQCTSLHADLSQFAHPQLEFPKCLMFPMSTTIGQQIMSMIIQAMSQLVTVLL